MRFALLLSFGLLVYQGLSAQAQDPLRSFRTTDSLLSQAVDRIRYGNPEGAIRLIAEAPDPTQRSFDAAFLTGYAYRMMGDLTHAIEAFSQATRYETYSLPAYFERGNCYLMRKQYNLAVFDYDRVILIDSTFAPAFNNRAYARIRNYGEQKMPMTQLKFARRDMEKVLQLQQRDSVQNAEYYYNLGLLDLYLSEYPLAAQSFSEALRLDDRSAKTYYFRGAAYFLGQYYERAREDFLKAEAMGFESSQTPEFLKVLELIRDHEQRTGERVGKE
jgi:tetratricopeptide (TPR) repeat protein